MSEFKVKEFAERMAVLKPENIQILLRSVEKRTETDDYEGGCDPSTTKVKEIEVTKRTFNSVVEMVQHYVGDNKITADQIGTFDPNVYRDRKGGGQPITVEDNTAIGYFRVMYDRAENSHGRPPSAKEREDFEAGKIKLKLADYEFFFNVSIVGVEEGELATLLGVNNW